MSSAFSIRNLSRFMGYGNRKNIPLQAVLPDVDKQDEKMFALYCPIKDKVLFLKADLTFLCECDTFDIDLSYAIYLGRV